jgi:hypothetical protein
MYDHTCLSSSLGTNFFNCSSGILLARSWIELEVVEAGRGTDEEGMYRALGREKGVMGVGAMGVMGLIERVGATGAY